MGSLRTLLGGKGATGVGPLEDGEQVWMVAPSGSDEAGDESLQVWPRRGRLPACVGSSPTGWRIIAVAGRRTEQIVVAPAANADVTVRTPAPTA